MIKKIQLLFLSLTLISISVANGQWSQKGNDIDGEAAGDQSGHSVSFSDDGETMAIGAGKNDGNGTDAGHVRIYNWNGSAWSQIGADIDGEAAGDHSGQSVSLSSDGQTVAIGSIFNAGNGAQSGHVRVYNWNGSAWSQLGADIDGEAVSNYSGSSVSLSSDGQTLAIGADKNSGNGSESGHVRVYNWNGSAWSQLGADIDGEMSFDLSGNSVSLSADGQTVVIGAYQNDGNGSESGHVRVYSWNGSAWSQLGADIDGEATGDYSGFSVSLSSDGQTVAIGSIFNAGNGAQSGHVRIFKWSGSAWYQVGTDMNGEAAGDQSGQSVSLSSDGETVAIGAFNNSGNGNWAGHVRVYNWNGSNWTQLGADIDGEATGDYSGFSVSLSNDGQTLAIGAPSNAGNGSNSGHVRVYQNITICPIPTSLALTSITSSSAGLEWTSTGASWNIEWGLGGFLPTGNPTVTGIFTKPYNLTGLTANTTYDFYVRNDCGMGFLSAWAGPFSFTTAINTGINESANNLDLSFYPNPNNGIFTINIKAKNVIVEVMNTKGQVILTKHDVNTNEHIDLTNNESGIYFVTVVSNETVTTQKVIVR